LYQHFVRIPDEEVGPLLRFLTFLSHEEILALDELTREHPERREAQRALARSVCRFVHGEDETSRAERAAVALYTGEIGGLEEPLLLEVFAEAPSSRLPRASLDGGLELDEALAASGLSKSKGAARTAIEQGGAYVNGRRRTTDDGPITRDDLLFGRYVVLRRGRREYHLLSFFE
ncbi:MAG: S4 domain-containing protein, partial [Acidimicrobiales bacterium]